MSFVIDSFDDTAKWAEIKLGTGVVSDRKTTSFKVVVSNVDDKAGLVTVDTHDLSSCDIRTLADRNTARTILLIRTVKDFTDPMPDEKEVFYAFIRDSAYGIQVYDGFGFPYIGSDPVNPNEIAELRITISAGIINFYYAGVPVYSASLRIPATSLYVYLMSHATAHGTTIAGTTVFQSGEPVPTYTLTLQQTQGGTISSPAAVYDSGQTAIITASAGSGFAFSRWLVDGVEPQAPYNTTNPLNLLMNSDHTVLAMFAEVPPPTGEVFDNCDSLTPPNGSWQITNGTEAQCILDGVNQQACVAAGGAWDIWKYGKCKLPATDPTSCQAAGGIWKKTFADNTFVASGGKLVVTMAAIPGVYDYNFGFIAYKRPNSGLWNLVGKELLRVRLTRSGVSTMPTLQLGLVFDDSNVGGNGWNAVHYTIGTVGTTETVIDIDLRTPDGNAPVDLSRIRQISFSYADSSGSGSTQLYIGVMEIMPAAYMPPQVIVIPTSGQIYVNDVLNISANGVYGTPSYTYAWAVNGSPSGSGATFAFSSANAGTYNVVCTLTDADGTAASASVTVIVEVLPPPIVPTLPNFLLIQDCPWITATGAPSSMRNVLDQASRPLLLRTLSYANMKYVVLFVGYWEAYDATNPVIWHPHPTTQEVTYGPVRDAAYYQEFISQCHALGVQVLAWIEDGNRGLMDIRSSNWSNVFPKIVDIINMGFDGFADDIENWYGKATQSDQEKYGTQIAYFEALTNEMHAIGKIHCPFTGFDWQQMMNPNLYNVDYNLQMFYSNATTFCDPQGNAFWQEMFGQYGRNTPPVAPLIVGLFFHTNNCTAYNTMAKQITKIEQLLATYPYPNLHGFFIWFYETMKPEDWTAWNSWVNTLPAKGIPPGITAIQHTLSIVSTAGGTTNPVPGNYEIYENITQQVTAIPDTDYMFDHWELDGVNVGASMPYSVTMNKDHAVLAVFVTKPPPPPTKQHLTISFTTGGTTAPAAGVWEYDQGSTAQVTATPNTGYLFKHWLFDNVIAGTDPTITVTMDADHTLVAVFEAVPPTPRLWTWPFLTWLRNLIKQGQG